MDVLRALRLRPAVVLTLAALLCSDWLRAEPPPSETDAERDAHDLILLAPAHPVFIRVRTQVDGQGLKSVREAYARQLLKQFDSSGDGFLDRQEAKAVPPLVKAAAANETVQIADRWEAVDVNPADDKVSPEELGAYIDRVFGSTFLLSLKAQRATQSVDLFSLLDHNRDGKISRSELESAAATLRKLDLDDDETFTVDELQPYRNPQLPQAAVAAGEEAADQPFLLLEDAESISKAAEQLLKRYGSALESTSAEFRIGGEALGGDPQQFASCDADGDGVLNRAELEALLHRPLPHLVVDAQFPQAKPVKRKLAVLEEHLLPGSSKPTTKGNKVTLSTNGIDLEMHMPSNQSARMDARDNRAFYATRFLQADQGKKKYLTEQEFAGLGLPNADFKSVDRNGDGMVTLDELMAQVNLELGSSQSRVELVVSNNGKSLFEVIDANSDRRVSRRELVHAFDRLRQFDRDGDETITAGELAGRYQAALQLGRPELLRLTRNMPQAQTAPITNRPTAGPEWFRKMDRNRDGDISVREFLGPPSAFKRLDADGDGLITAEEAEGAK